MHIIEKGTFGKNTNSVLTCRYIRWGSCDGDEVPCLVATVDLLEDD